MRGGSGPGRKGHRFERDVAAMVCAALGLSKDQCYRTPLSGGHGFSAKQDPGDLVILPKLLRRFPFVVECKHEKDASVAPFFDDEGDRRKKEKEWMDQVISAAENAKVVRNPLLVFKVGVGKNSVAFCVAMSEFAPSLSGASIAYFKYKHRDWFLMRFDKFLAEWADVEADLSLKRKAK